MEHPFLARLSQGPLLADGAMGTELFVRGARPDQCLDELNLSSPDLIHQVHREYIAAGADLIETNTFGANRFRLAAFGLADRVREINRRGAEIAREARDVMGESVIVAGAIGPSGVFFPTAESVSYADVANAIGEQVEPLVERGVDVLLFETFSDLDELAAAVSSAQKICDLPIIAQVTFGDDHHLASGHDVCQVVAELHHLAVPVIGINCGIGPRQALDLLGELVHAGQGFVSVMPNAGFPVRVGGRIAYLATPDYFARFARDASQAGAVLVGGCCGTTPEHIRAMRAALPRDSKPIVTHDAPRPQLASVPLQTTTETLTHLAAKLNRGEFVVSVEVDPPKGTNPAKALNGVSKLKEAGADVINIGDSPMAKVRMSGLGLALLIQKEVGLETIIHFTSRDRNLMALQSDLLGAHALGIRHVLALTGDPPRGASATPASPIWDVDSIGLVGILKRMNAGIDLAGASVGRPTRFLVGCAVNPNANDLELELERFRRKIDAGADFVMSQPLFSMEQLERFLSRVGPLSIPHILGILPLESYRQAEFLHHEVPGFDIPCSVRDAIRDAGDHAGEVGLHLAEAFVAQARSFVSGIYVITSYGRYDAAVELTRSVSKATADRTTG